MPRPMLEPFRHAPADFTPAPRSSAGTARGHIERVESLVSGKIEDHPNMPRHEAFAQVMRENPELRAGYVRAIQKQQVGRR